MTNYVQAPKLYVNGLNKKEDIIYIIPQTVMAAIYNQLSGNQGNAIKVITVLLGTLGDGTFGVSEKWMLDTTGMAHNKYIAARKTLVDKGWITLVAGQSITVNVKKILEGYHNDTSCTDSDVTIRNDRRYDTERTDVTIRNDMTLRYVTHNKEEQVSNKEITSKAVPVVAIANLKENDNDYDLSNSLAAIADHYNVTNTRFLLDDLQKDKQGNVIHNKIGAEMLVAYWGCHLAEIAAMRKGAPSNLYNYDKAVVRGLDMDTVQRWYDTATNNNYSLDKSKSVTGQAQDMTQANWKNTREYRDIIMSAQKEVYDSWNATDQNQNQSNQATGCNNDNYGDGEDDLPF